MPLRDDPRVIALAEQIVRLSDLRGSDPGELTFGITVDGHAWARGERGVTFFLIAEDLWVRADWGGLAHFGRYDRHGRLAQADHLPIVDPAWN